ncbi:helix-turn-helix DNA binding domain protein [Streptomyces phage Satis]|nr:helix-turn-helix DNA binding domain protein [Streptomyces phage Satis]QBZ71985.1 helix-turn-helix DNA binding domain protein [Streptomyces phage Kradal]QPL14404.1 helix-turn-helix DNA binding domain protein [Streptomyces phage EhyElimayoE]
MMNTNPNDPLVSIAEAASRMGVKVGRARSILAKNLVRPVRTPAGIAYRLEDVVETKRMYQ